MLNTLGYTSFMVVTSLLLITIVTSISSRTTINHYVYKIYVNNAVSLYTIGVTLSMVALLKAHILSDYSYINVIHNSHTIQPILYRITGLWGNHEGSMLWILSLYTYSILLMRGIPSIVIKKALTIQSTINLFFILFILTTSNPFTQVVYRSIEGEELNPVLQDIVLAIHPPLIYAGYIGLSIPLSFTIAYLQCYGLHHKQWSHVVKLYNYVSWSFLTLGITLGSWWAYYELGWGGWWFWDPVENASLLPWIVSTALLHSIVITSKNHRLVHWTIILSIAGFYSSVLGTFFVRSGFLDSVHSFTSDANKGIFILCFLLIGGIYISYIYTTYSKHIYTADNKHIYIKEIVIFINQVFFASFYAIIALGTFYPSIHELWSHRALTLGPSFYNQALIPLVIPFILMLNISFMSDWYFRTNTNVSINLGSVLRESVSVLGISLGTVGILILSGYKGPFILYIVVMILVWLVKCLYLALMRSKKQINIPMYIAHIGFMFIITSITLWYCFSKEDHVVMRVGEQHTVSGYTYTLRAVNQTKGPNYDAYSGSYVISKQDTVIGVLFPEKRHYIVQDLYASKVDIHSNPINDIHSIIGDGSIYTGWATSLYVYPAISYIWLGGLLLMLAGITSILYIYRYTYKNNIFNNTPK